MDILRVRRELVFRHSKSIRLMSGELVEGELVEGERGFTSELSLLFKSWLKIINLKSSLANRENQFLCYLG